MLTLQVPPGFIWRAGQYLALPAAGETLYLSIANHCDGSGRVELVVALPSELAAPGNALVGPDYEAAGLERRAAVRLAALTLGGRLRIEGPHGSMYGWDCHATDDLATETRVLVSHGTGIAPMRALWQEARQRNQPTLLLQGARTAADLIFSNEFSAAALHASPSTTHYWPTLTVPPDGWTGRYGRVQRTFSELAAWVQHKRVAVFACGRQAMVDDLKRHLVDSGAIAEDKLQSEAHG